jgi:hypothetical protein
MNSPALSRSFACAALVALTLSGCATSAASPPSQTPVNTPANTAATELPLHQLVGSRLITVDVEVGGKTLTFLLDTGGGVTIVSPETATLAGCTPFGRATGFRWNGERLDLPRCLSVPMRLGPLALAPEAAVIDIEKLGLRGVDGFVALQTLDGQAFTLDFTGRRLFLETPASLARRVHGMRELSMREAHQAGGATLDLFVEVAAPTGNLWLELDSGNAGPVLLSPHALQQLGIEVPTDKPQTVTLNVHGLGPVPVEAIQRDGIYDGLLNAAFFEGRLITFDLAAERVWVSEKVGG